MFILPETNLLKVKEKRIDQYSSSFEIEPFLPGYGLTIGNAIRRVLLSSLSGSAITSVKIDGATHEFSTIKGVKEDVVELIINLKGLKVKLNQVEPAQLKLDKKGPGTVVAGDFVKNADVEIIDATYPIATLDKNSNLKIEAVVELGRGYVPTEKNKDEKLPLGSIAIDAIFTPIKRVHYQVENTRVGGMTNYDKLLIDITTDGSIDPNIALKTAIKMLIEHFDFIDSQISEEKPAQTKKSIKAEKKVKEAKKTSKPKKIIKED